MFANAGQTLSQEQMAFATLVANYNGYKSVPSPTATLTLTQSGLLAALLQHQRYEAITLAWRQAHREKVRAAFWRKLTTLFRVPIERMPDNKPAKRLIGTVPRHT